jgi:hypothetical protein
MPSLYKSFPSVDNKSGLVYLKPSQASNNSKLLSEKGVDSHLSQHFPQGAVHYVTCPEHRAKCHNHKNVSGQMTMAMERTKKWSLDSMKAAATEFEVPEDTKILLIFPEIFDREILFRDERYHVPIEGTDGKGVKTPCPWCLSNKCVKFKDKSGYKAGQHLTICGY